MSELHFNSLSGASVGWHLVGECVCVSVCVISSVLVYVAIAVSQWREREGEECNVYHSPVDPLILHKQLVNNFKTTTITQTHTHTHTDTLNLLLPWIK